MPRAAVNRSGEMEMFVRVVDHGALSAAARSLRMTPSALSKLVARMEKRLGTRLVNRSTRKLQLTPEGAAFYERCVKVLADIDEAERSAASSAAPCGRVRINVNVPFGLHYLFPLLPTFSAQHPEITLDMVTDRSSNRPFGAARGPRHPGRSAASFPAHVTQAWGKPYARCRRARLSGPLRDAARA